MKQEIKNEIDKRIEKLNLPRTINKSWYYNFFEFLTDVKYKTDDLNGLLDFIFDPQSAEKTKNTLIDSCAVKLQNRSYDSSQFFSYLKNKIEESNLEPQEYVSEMINFMKKEADSKIPFVDLMVKYAILKHPEDLIIDRSRLVNIEKTYEALTNIKIAGLTLCSLSVDCENERDLTCIGFRASDGLKGLRLGTILLDDLFRFAKERNPDAVIYGFNVMVRNKSAQKMYEKFGGKFYKSGEDLENKNFLTSDEYSQSTDVRSGWVLFDNEAVSFVASSERPKPLTMQEYLRKYRMADEPDK